MSPACTDAIHWHMTEALAAIDGLIKADHLDGADATKLGEARHAIRAALRLHGSPLREMEAAQARRRELAMPANGSAA